MQSVLWVQEGVDCRECTKRTKKEGEKADEQMRHKGYVHTEIASSHSLLTIVPRTVVEAMFVQSVWEMHPSAGVEADALRLSVAVTENGSTHLPQL